MQTDTSVYLKAEGGGDQPSQQIETPVSKDNLSNSNIKTGDGLFVCCVFLGVLLVCICILVIAVKKSRANLQSQKDDLDVGTKYKHN